MLFLVTVLFLQRDTMSKATYRKETLGLAFVSEGWSMINMASLVSYTHGTGTVAERRAQILTGK